MPIYEYYCSACNEKFSQRRPMSAASEPAECAACGAVAQKVLTAAMVTVAGRSAEAAMDTAAAEMSAGGGCACGRGGCGCGGGMGGLN